MINFNFRISTPWIPAKYEKIYGNKGTFFHLFGWDFELLHYALDLFCVYLSLTSYADKTALKFGGSFWGYALNVKLYVSHKRYKRKVNNFSLA